MDIMGMMKKAQAMQAKLQEAQEELGRVEVEGASGGGMVSITMTAKGELKGVADRSVAADPVRQGDAGGPDHRRLRRRQGQGRSRRGGKDAGADRRTAAAAGHEAAVLNGVERRRAGDRAADPAAGAPAGPRAALGAAGGAASHPQARDAASAARRGDAGRRGAHRHLLGLRQRRLRAIPARSARTSSATPRPSSSSNRSAISGRSSGRARSGPAITCSAACCRRSTASARPTSTSTSLVARVAAGGIGEVILAVNATVDGQTTAHYIIDLLAGRPVKVTRLAHGVPVGGELDYLDDGTLAAAMRQRTAF